MIPLFEESADNEPEDVVADLHPADNGEAGVQGAETDLDVDL